MLADYAAFLRATRADDLAAVAHRGRRRQQMGSYTVPAVPARPGCRPSR
jgi:hypothetical protein